MNEQTIENKFSKKLKNYQKQKLRYDLKTLKHEHEYELNLLSGTYTDKISKLKSTFLFGSINEEQYKTQVLKIQQEKQEKIDALKQDYLTRKEELANKEVDTTNIDPLILDSYGLSYKLKKYAIYSLRSLKNKTFLYILRRLLLSMITLILIVCFVIILLSFIPDDKFYDIAFYKKLKAQSGDQIAQAWLNAQLYKYGRVDLQGNKIMWYQQILNYLYWILPFPKTIPVRYGLDWKPIKFEHVLIYFGNSINLSKPITELIRSRMGISFTISISALVFNYLFAYPLGVAMSKKPGGIVDKIGNLFIVANLAIPALVFYLFMNKIFGIGIGNFSFGFSYNDKRKFITLIPPIFCIVFLSIPGTAIWVRRFMVDELNSDYVKFAKSKGLSSNKIMYTHVLRNAIVPLVRGIPTAFIFAIVGSYFVESIWSIPGTGLLLVQGMTAARPDITIILGLTTIYSAMGMLAFILGDIVTVFTDPRIKLQRG